MDEDKRSLLSNKEMLFTLLATIINKNDGKVRISEEDMDSVSKEDMFMMYYDKPAKEIILTNYILKSKSKEDN
jgi:hypothetical protein|tara:strand:- start:1436 stop:1654 length:219 start_codon:yes stop_codon:yes gene_type:complete